MSSFFSRIRDDYASFSEQAFRQPDSLLQPVYAWVWNDRIDFADVCRQIDRFKEAGIRGIYIIPEPKNFRPATMRTALEPDYLSPAFMELVDKTARYAASEGLRFWLYDEGGWPSGSARGRTAALNPGAVRKNLVCSTLELRAGEEYVPAERDVAAFAEGRRILPHDVLPKDTALSVFKIEQSGPEVTDSLADGIGEAFIKTTHELYADALQLGKGSSQFSGSGPALCMFTDEPGTGSFPWPDGFVAKFKNKYGYDLTDHLPELASIGKDCSPDGLRARQDYRELQGELFQANYLRPLREWSNGHGLLFTGHLDIDHRSDGCLSHGYGTVLEQLREFDVPGIDVIWYQIGWPDKEGRACPEGNGFFERFASSAASQTGGTLAMSESFGAYGQGMDGDLLRFVINHQLVRGINLFNFMEISGSSRGAFPFVERPCFQPESPGFFHLSTLNDYTARASYLMQLGEPGARCALYYPARDIWGGGTQGRLALDAFDRTGRRLESSFVDFDVIDEKALCDCCVENGRIVIGRAVYTSLVIPDGCSLPDSLAGKFSALSASPSPEIGCSSDRIRVRKRLCPDGSILYMLFNEDTDPFSGPVEFFESGYRSMLDTADGSIRTLPGKDLRLEPGEAAFVLFSQKPLPNVQSAPVRTVRTYTAEDFTLRPVRKSSVSAEGLCESFPDAEAFPAEAGPWAPYLGKDFSGEAVYRTQIRLDRAPCPGETYLLSIGKAEIFARVSIQGRQAGILWAAPMQLRLDGGFFARKQVLDIEIEVANTICNQLEANPPEKLFEALDLGPYHARCRTFEQSCPAGGLYGPVTLTLVE